MARKKDRRVKKPAHAYDLGLLLGSLNRCPSEIISQIVEYLEYDRRHLQALKYAGHAIWQQVTPVLHRILHLKLDDKGDDYLCDLPIQRFLVHVRSLHVIDTRNDEAGPHRRTFPTRKQYFALLETVAQLERLKIAYIHAIYWDEEVSSTFIDILSALPELETLKIKGGLQSLDLHSLDASIHAGVRSAPYNTGIKMSQLSSVHEPSFETLRHLTIQTWHQTVLESIFEQSKPMEGLLALDIRHVFCHTTGLIKMLSGSCERLQRLRLHDDRNAPCGIYLDSDLTQYGKFHFPHLLLFSCSKPLHNSWTSRGLSAMVWPLGVVSAPNLQVLGCGHVLDGEKPERLEKIALQWPINFPNLEHILARHFPPHTGPAFLEEEPERQEVMRRNIEIVENIFRGTKTKLICLGEEEYDEYFTEHLAKL